MDATRRRQNLFAAVVVAAVGLLGLLSRSGSTAGIVIGVLCVVVGAGLFLAVLTHHYPPWWNTTSEDEN